MSGQARTDAALRFVILHHVQSEGEHWDLMLEHGAALLTWQLELNPVEHSDVAIPARRIFDHRKDFLTYEGPISRNRGHVERVESGFMEWEKLTDHECVVWLGGNVMAGTYHLRRRQGEEWVFAVAGS
jgi:hypothetical protein